VTVGSDSERRCWMGTEGVGCRRGRRGGRSRIERNKMDNRKEKTYVCGRLG
jgi:hypothetical protein